MTAFIISGGMGYTLISAGFLLSCLMWCVIVPRLGRNRADAGRQDGLGGVVPVGLTSRHRI